MTPGTQRPITLAVEVTTTAECESCSECIELVDDSAELLVPPPQAEMITRQAQPEAASKIRVIEMFKFLYF